MNTLTGSENWMCVEDPFSQIYVVYSRRVYTSNIIIEIHYVGYYRLVKTFLNFGIPIP